MDSTPLQLTLKLYEEIKTSWKSKNYAACKVSLEKAKVQLAYMEFLSVSDSNASESHLLLCQNILEIGSLCSIALEDIKQFDAYVAQLKTYYVDYGSKLPVSVYQYEILGLNLLRLLADNKLEEFHTEIDTLPIDKLLSDCYLQHPLHIEQYMMEGSYNKIFQLRHNVPSKMYTIFMDSLLKTVRNQISFCIVKAYTHLKLKDATRMLHFTNDVETVHFANEKKWVMRDHVFNFDTVESDYPEMKYENVIDKTMAYAHELENI